MKKELTRESIREMHALNNETDISRAGLQKPMRVILRLLIDRLYDNHAQKSASVGWHNSNKNALISEWLNRALVIPSERIYGPGWEKAEIKLDIDCAPRMVTTFAYGMTLCAHMWDGCRSNEPDLYFAIFHIVKLLSNRIRSTPTARAGKVAKKAIWKAKSKELH